MVVHIVTSFYERKMMLAIEVRKGVMLISPLNAGSSTKLFLILYNLGSNAAGFLDKTFLNAVL